MLDLEYQIPLNIVVIIQIMLMFLICLVIYVLFALVRFFDNVDYIVPLSIRKIKLSTDILYHEENWGTKHSSEDLRKVQENDPELSIIMIIINWLESGNKPTESDLSLSSPAVKHLWLHRSQLSFRNNVLYYHWAYSTAVPNVSILSYARFFIRQVLRTNGSESSERTNVRALRVAKTAQIT